MKALTSWKLKNFNTQTLDQTGDPNVNYKLFKK